ncbi:hypothetical protein Hpkin71_05000 [Helicobacter pylori]
MPLCYLRLAILCNHKKVNSISLCRFLFLEVFIMGTCSMALTRLGVNLRCMVSNLLQSEMELTLLFMIGLISV